MSTIKETDIDIDQDIKVRADNIARSGDFFTNAVAGLKVQKAKEIQEELDDMSSWVADRVVKAISPHFVPEI